MKLYHPEHGEWEGEPIDAMVMLERGWQEKPIAAKPAPDAEPVVEEKPKRGRKAKG